MLLETDAIWPYKQWGVKALVALGRKVDAIRYAEACRGPWTNDPAVDAVCEEILLSSGLADEAYRRYGLRAHAAGSYAAAKDAGLLDVAVELARRCPVDPKTLTRAARDFAESEPEFAVQVGLLALGGFVQGRGYEVTGADVLAAHVATVKAAKQLGRLADVRRRVAPGSVPARRRFTWPERRVPAQRRCFP